MKMGKLPIGQNGEPALLVAIDNHTISKKATFKEPNKDSLREDSLNRYIEAAKVKLLIEFPNEKSILK